MASSQKHDLRDGMSRIEPTTNAKMPGLSDSILPTEPDDENAVKPLAGSKGGVAEGQGTKSN
jgi:hypothetical protein